MNNKNKNKDSEKKSKIEENKNDKKKSQEEKISTDKNKEILNKKRNREEEKKENKKKIVKKPPEKKYISDEESESDSEDISYSAESEDDSSESYSSISKSSIKKNTTTKIKNKTSVKKEKKIKKDSDISSKKKTSLKPKGILVYEILERWWYALPSWPPENYDTSGKLKENKLRLVKITDWKREPKKDKDNFEKCFELPGYKYVYLNTDGKVFDFRPEEGKPCYNNLIKLPDIKLYEYLVKALKAQLEELEKRNSVNENDLRKKIKEKLDKAERNLAHYKK